MLKGPGACMSACRAIGTWSLGYLLCEALSSVCPEHPQSATHHSIREAGSKHWLVRTKECVRGYVLFLLAFSALQLACSSRPQGFASKLGLVEKLKFPKGVASESWRPEGAISIQPLARRKTRILANRLAHTAPHAQR